MKAVRPLAFLATFGVLATASGCMFAPKSELTAAQTHNRVLAEQRRALLAQVANLEVHKRNLEDNFFRTEEELRLLTEEVGMDGKELAEYRRQRAELHEQVRGLANGRSQVPEEIGRQLAALSERYPSLQYDPATGIGKLDSDVLFDSGQTGLRPRAKQMLEELVWVLKRPEAAELKMMVVGHTDDRQIAGRSVREQHANNFHLSTARALAVADLMCREGLPQDRLGVAGFGSHQPVASNDTPEQRRQNRRVEIFVMGRDVPVVGWTDSIPSVY